jgi:hypothetical protein
MTTQGFQNIFLIGGLLMLILGAFLRQKEQHSKRGSRLFWWGFTITLVGLMLDPANVKEAVSGFMAGWNETRPK